MKLQTHRHGRTATEEPVGKLQGGCWEGGGGGGGGGWGRGGGGGESKGDEVAKTAFIRAKHDP